MNVFGLFLVSALAQPYSPDWLSWHPGQPLVVVAAEKNPFWHKEKVRAKLRDERAIQVSVKVVKSPNPGYERLRLMGAGWVQTDVAVASQVAQDFPAYPGISEYIKSVTWAPQNGSLKMTTEAYGYRAFLDLQIATLESPASGGGKTSEILFRVIGGVFQGMTGRVTLVPISEKVSEISLTAAFDFVKLPMPKFFVEFGLEVALQRMAGALRNHLESVAKAKARIPRRDEKERKGDPS